MSGSMDIANSPYAQRVALLVDRITRLTRELQFVDGLNPAQWEALRYLARANRQSRTPGALAKFLGATKGTASQTLIALENKGFVARSRSDADRRQIELTLTAAGRALVERDPIVSIEQAATELTEDVSAPLVRGLSRVLHHLQRSHGIQEFGVCEECTLFCVNHPEQAAPGNQCGLTGEPIPEGEQTHICINYRGAA